MDNYLRGEEHNGKKEKFWSKRKRNKEFEQHPGHSEQPMNGSYCGCCSCGKEREGRGGGGHGSHGGGRGRGGRGDGEGSEVEATWCTIKSCLHLLCPDSLLIVRDLPPFFPPV